MSSSDKERVYYVVKGSITVNGKEESHVLNAGDLLYIAPANKETWSSMKENPRKFL